MCMAVGLSGVRSMVLMADPEQMHVVGDTVPNADRWANCTNVPVSF
jgi:hypothetical protein